MIGNKFFIDAKTLLNYNEKCINPYGSDDPQNDQVVGDNENWRRRGFRKNLKPKFIFRHFFASDIIVLPSPLR